MQTKNFNFVVLNIGDEVTFCIIKRLNWLNSWNWILGYKTVFLYYLYCGRLNIPFGPTAAICILAMKIKLAILVIGITGSSDVLGMAVIKCAKQLFVSMGVGCCIYSQSHWWICSQLHTFIHDRRAAIINGLWWKHSIVSNWSGEVDL